MFPSTFVFLMVLAPSAIQVSARPAKSCGSAGGPGKIANGKAIYMLSNHASNSVVAVPLSDDGSLNEAGGSSTNTGGAGANGVDGSTNQPAAPDPLFSQSALTVAGNVSQPLLDFSEPSQFFREANTRARACSQSTRDPTPSPCSPLTPRTQRSLQWSASPPICRASSPSPWGPL